MLPRNIKIGACYELVCSIGKDKERFVTLVTSLAPDFKSEEFPVDKNEVPFVKVTKKGICKVTKHVYFNVTYKDTEYYAFAWFFLKRTYSK